MVVNQKTKKQKGEQNMNEITTQYTKALSAVETGIDSQIATAHRYPRDAGKAVESVKAMALLNEDVAASCYYRLERKGREGKANIIEGPSIRLAELFATSWGNLRIATRIVEVGEKSVIVEAMAHDLESNLASMVTKSRSITGKFGRYSQDMIEVTTAAAMSIARREAIFQVVPRVFAEAIFEECKKFSVGAAKLQESIQRAVGAFAKHGVKVEHLETKLEKKIGEVDTEDLVRLRGLLTAIKEGHTSVEVEFFGKAEKENAADAINAALDAEAE